MRPPCGRSATPSGCFIRLGSLWAGEDEAAAARDWQLAEINHAIDELVQAREQVAKALADLDLLKQKLLAK